MSDVVVRQVTGDCVGIEQAKDRNAARIRGTKSRSKDMRVGRGRVRMFNEKFDKNANKVKVRTLKTRDPNSETANSAVSL